MTDAEINLAIAKIEYPDGSYPQFDTPVSGLAVDYCDSWSDIGPIIEREEIQISSARCEKRSKVVWVAQDYWAIQTNTATAETPTRAAALCYLKMKGVE